MSLSELDPEIEREAKIFSRGSESQFRRAMRRMIHTRSAQVGLALVLTFLIIGLLAPVVWPYNARADLDLKERLQPPTSSHLFGTDDLGRDVLRRDQR